MQRQLTLLWAAIGLLTIALVAYIWWDTVPDQPDEPAINS